MATWKTAAKQRIAIGGGLVGVPRLDRHRRFWRRELPWFQRHPEWWSLTISAAAWLVWLSPRSPPWPGALCRVAAPLAPWQAVLNLGDPARISAWISMTLAMMMPLAAASIRQAAFLSLWRRRHRAIGGFLAGYLGCWLAAAIVLQGLSGAAASQAAAGSVAILGFMTAMIWQLTPCKARALAECHQTRALAPSGWQADRDCLLYGMQHAAACIRSCWALMLLASLTGHGAAIMLGATGIAWAERYRRLAARPSVLALLGLLALQRSTAG
ncbi:DUF2182 domain-containing protein [Chromobacterium sphagni]|nr:DUF2182 domain-containing protein [Chromobacterium sphagni]